MRCLLLASFSSVVLFLVNPFFVQAFQCPMKASRIAPLLSKLDEAEGESNLPSPSSSSSSSFEASRRDVFVSSAKNGFLFLTSTTAAFSAPMLIPQPALAADDTSKLKAMKAIEFRYELLANTNGAPEKHIPKVTLKDIPSNDELRMVEVLVPHVMDGMDAENPHWIKAIWLREERSGDVAIAKVFPPTESNSPPTLICGVPKGAKLTPLLYCNLHGLWKGETFTA